MRKRRRSRCNFENRHCDSNTSASDRPDAVFLVLRGLRMSCRR